MSRPPSAESGIHGRDLAGTEAAPLLFSPSNTEDVVVRLCSEYNLHIHRSVYCYMPDGMRCRARAPVHQAIAR